MAKEGGSELTALTRPAAPPDARASSRIRWRCRRGARELDLILSAFVDEHYRALNGAERRLFAQLLEHADPQLADWLCHGVPPTDHGMATIVERILSAHHA